MTSFRESPGGPSQASVYDIYPGWSQCMCSGGIQNAVHLLCSTLAAGCNFAEPMAMHILDVCMFLFPNCFQF